MLLLSFRRGKRQILQFVLIDQLLSDLVGTVQEVIMHVGTEVGTELFYTGIGVSRIVQQSNQGHIFRVKIKLLTVLFPPRRLSDDLGPFRQPDTDYIQQFEQRA